MANETGNVVKKEANLPVAGMFEQDASQGLENMDQQDLALPFLGKKYACWRNLCNLSAVLPQ